MDRQGGTNLDRQGGTATAASPRWFAALRSRAEPLLRPSPKLVILVAAIFAVDQYLYQVLGSSIGFRGPFDETDHVLTTVLLVWAFFPRFGWRELIPALLASTLIDLDHIPGQLGYDWLTGGGPRPYTHSLATVAVLLLLAWTWRRHRRIFLCLALGVCSHLWRDLAEPAGSAVSLFWPVTDRGVHLDPAVYLGSIGICAAVAFWRAWGAKYQRCRSNRRASERAALAHQVDVTKCS